METRIKNVVCLCQTIAAILCSFNCLHTVLLVLLDAAANKKIIFDLWFRCNICEIVLWDLTVLVFVVSIFRPATGCANGRG